MNKSKAIQRFYGLLKKIVALFSKKKEPVTTKQQHGWVLFDTESREYLVDYQDHSTPCLSEAKVFRTRKEARKLKLGKERIKKVSLDCQGKAVAVIGRG